VSESGYERLNGVQYEVKVNDHLRYDDERNVQCGPTASKERSGGLRNADELAASSDGSG